MTFEEAVDIERARQDEKWGEQNHDPFIWCSILGEEKGEVDKASLEYIFGDKPGQRILEELVHTAAVAKAMWECGVRNGWNR